MKSKNREWAWRSRSRAVRCVLALLLIVGGGVVACEQAEETGEKAKEKSEQVSEGASELAEGAEGLKEGAEEALESETAERVKEGAIDSLKGAKDLAKRAAESDAAKRGGEVAASTWKALKAKVADSPDDIEAFIDKSKQIVGATVTVYRVLDKVVDSDTSIEPIVQPVGEPGEDEVDDAIGDMPNTEVVDDVTVGFKQIKSTDNDTRTDEDGFLVVWRRDDRIVGFVYRSKRDIHLAELRKEIPTLVRAVNEAMQ